MSRDQLLDLDRGHVDATALDDLLQSRMEDEAAIGIELAEIPGVEEPVGAQRFRRLLRIIQITGGGVPPDQDEPDLSRRQIEARCRIDEDRKSTRLNSSH